MRGSVREMAANSRRWMFLVALGAFSSSSILVHAQAVSDPPVASTIVAQPTPPTAGRPAVSFGANGLLFSTSDGATTLRVHGYVQADDRMFSSNVQGEPLDTFLFRRIRPLFEGTLFNTFDYRFMPDFGQNNPQIQESYLEWRTFSFAKVRLGKFKEPIGLEVLQSDRDLTFAERSMASDLVPLRYMGAQLGGSVFTDAITYDVGYFNGSSDGSNGNFQWIPDNEVVARLFLHPFAKTPLAALRHFGLGAAGSSANQHGAIAGLKTVGQSTFFKYSSKTVADGQHTRVSPQAYYYVGRFGALSEYVISSQDVQNKNVSGNITNRAWEATGSVMLTGEKNSYNEIRPLNAFEPTRGVRHLGAVQLAFRYSTVRIDSGAFPVFASASTAAQEAQERGIGLNWYLNRYTKLMTDYEHTSFRMALGKAPLHSEDVLMSRIQLAF
jgi:phosphate-selective porin OprO and OprP